MLHPRLLICVVCLLLASCKILQTATEGGSIESRSGNADCAAGETCEVISEEGEGFSDTFTAVPAEGYRFEHWREGDGYLCGGQSGPCALEDIPTEFSDQDITVLLEPVFSNELAEAGDTVYRLRQDSGNTFACVHCHALEEPAENGFRRAGHRIGDALGRPFYKNGGVDTMLEAVNSCLDEWMNADTWTEESEEWIALQAYLESENPVEAAPPVFFELAPVPDELGGGDGDAGRELFNYSCAICHDIDGEGSNLAPKISGLGLEADYIARRVRSSGRSNSEVYDGLTGGIMPFWSADRLSDNELRDLIAYLQNGSDSDVIDAGDETPVDDSGCGSDHPKVGQSAVLIERFHDVNGTARIVDNCTIVVEDFHYDGEGIVVEFYAGNNGNYGFSISENIKGTRYTGQDFTIRLDDSVSLDDFNGISVWCVEVGISFGDGLFQ